MPGSVRATGMHRMQMPWGLLAGLEVVALAVLSLVLVLGQIPAAFDVEWGCVGTTGEARTAADTYVAAFAVLGALGWIVAAAATALTHATGRRWLAVGIPLAWFGALVLAALVSASAIGPLTC